MIQRIRGVILRKVEKNVVVEVGGIGLGLTISKKTFTSLPSIGEEVILFSHLYMREDMMALYGFETEAELSFFEMLISVSGVGPKSALSVLDVAPLDQLAAAIQEGRPDLLSQASGIGRKTSERIIIELRTKVSSSESGIVVGQMDSDADALDALVGLGYRKEEARAALQKVGNETRGVEARLKIALKFLNNKGK